HLTIVERYFEQQQVTTIGQRQDAEVTATIIINDGRFFARMLKGGSIAAGEAFMDGWWESPDLTAVIELMARNMSTLDAMENQSGWLT
ncbi:SAM-dependent methyltransferase, partial [Vibrio campbellii]